MDFTTDDLKNRFRIEVDDATAPYLWGDGEIYGYMSEAADALNKETDASYKIITLPLTANQRIVPLPRNLLNIRGVRLVALDRQLEPANAEDTFFLQRSDYFMDYTHTMFGVAPGIPRNYVRDFERRALILIPPSAAVDSLEIQGTVTNAVPLCAGMPMPFLDEEEQRLILHHIKFNAFLKHDAETYDVQQSGEFKALFDAGAKERAVRLRNYRRAPGVVQMEW